MNETLDSLSKAREANQERAYAVLGCRPGPGIDVIIIPDAGKYRLISNTPCGIQWLSCIWLAHDCDRSKLAQLKSLLFDWGMTWEISWDQVIDQKLD